MKRVFVNGIELEDFGSDVTIQQMINVVRSYIYRFTGQQVNIVLNQDDMNMELARLEYAYQIAVEFMQ